MWYGESRGTNKSRKGKEIKGGKVKETEKMKYLGMTINTSGNLKDHIDWQKLQQITFAKRLMS